MESELLMNGRCMTIDENFDKYVACYETLARDILVDALDKSYPTRFADLKGFMHDTSNDTLADIGSSQGLFLRGVDAKYKVAFDLSETFLKVTPREFNPVRGNAEHIPFRDKTFDTVVASDILEHVFHPDMVVKEISRILKDEGVFYLVVPWKEDISKYEMYKGKYDYCHLRSFDALSTAAMLHGFKIKKTKGSILNLPYVCGSYSAGRVCNHVLRFIERVSGWQVVPYVHMMIEARKC